MAERKEEKNNVEMGGGESEGLTANVLQSLLRERES